MTQGLILIILLASFGLAALASQYAPAHQRLIRFDIEGELHPPGSYIEYQGKVYQVARAYEDYLMAAEVQ